VVVRDGEGEDLLGELDNAVGAGARVGAGRARPRRVATERHVVLISAPSKYEFERAEVDGEKL